MVSEPCLRTEETDTSFRGHVARTPESNSEAVRLIQGTLSTLHKLPRVTLAGKDCFRLVLPLPEEVRQCIQSTVTVPDPPARGSNEFGNAPPHASLS